LAVLAENSGITNLLLDIEGTTTPVDFVYESLFPFAAERVEAYLRQHAAEVEIAGLVEELRREHATDRAKHPALGPWLHASGEEERISAAKYVRHLIALDRKVTPLKTLQGKIWEEGFLSGALLGDVYGDVPRAFERWKAAGKRIAIFSSGSVLAQKLLFGHSKAGDLTRYIDGYFDTTTGPKRKAASYTAIAMAMGVQAESVLFVSDVVAELQAARDAGMETALMLRPGTAQPEKIDHVCLKSFDEVFAET